MNVEAYQSLPVVIVIAVGFVIFLGSLWQGRKGGR